MEVFSKRWKRWTVKLNQCTIRIPANTVEYINALAAKIESHL